MQKTLSFAVIHFITAFTVTWLITGDILIGGAVALLEPSVNTVMFFFHEKLWERFAPTAGSRLIPFVAPPRQYGGVTAPQ